MVRHTDGSVRVSLSESHKIDVVKDGLSVSGELLLSMFQHKVFLSLDLFKRLYPRPHREIVLIILV